VAAARPEGVPALDKPVRRRIGEAVDALAADPRPAVTGAQQNAMNPFKVLSVPLASALQSLGLTGDEPDWSAAGAGRPRFRWPALRPASSGRGQA
jgi:hypothetical protein